MKPRTIYAVAAAVILATTAAAALPHPAKAYILAAAFALSLAPLAIHAARNARRNH